MLSVKKISKVWINFFGQKCTGARDEMEVSPKEEMGN